MSSLAAWLGWLLWGQDLKRLIWVAAMAVAACGTLAAAAPGQCTLSGYDAFDCDVALDGGGLTFTLPDGQIFAFTLIEEGMGTAYLIDPEAAPGQRPDELREFEAVEGRPGCWARDEDYEFCVLVQQ
jgi:hypothetical protein